MSKRDSLYAEVRTHHLDELIVFAEAKAKQSAAAKRILLFVEATEGENAPAAVIQWRAREAHRQLHESTELGRKKKRGRKAKVAPPLREVMMVRAMDALIEGSRKLSQRQAAREVLDAFEPEPVFTSKVGTTHKNSSPEGKETALRDLYRRHTRNGYAVDLVSYTLAQMLEAALIEAGELPSRDDLERVGQLDDDEAMWFQIVRRFRLEAMGEERARSFGPPDRGSTIELLDAWAFREWLKHPE